MEVSKLCLGCMGFGEPERGREKWSIGETESREVIKKALESGINFFDTANLYSSGSSEEIVGKALKDFANRDEIVLASKLYFPMFDGPNAKGLSRKSIFAEIDHSLKRLQTDYLDLYIIHRWDYGTPIEETMEALDRVVESGKVRYVGCSNQNAHAHTNDTPQYSCQSKLLYNLVVVLWVSNVCCCHNVVPLTREKCCFKVLNFRLYLRFLV